MPEKVDTRCDRAVAEAAAAAFGVLAISELRACGLTDGAIRDRLARGRLHRLHRGVYAVGHVAVPLERRFLAAVRASGPGAVLSHMSAAALWGLLRWDERFPEVTVAGTSTRTHRGIWVHRTRAFAPDETRRHQGIPITSPVRTLGRGRDN